MSRRPEGDKAMSDAQRQARRRARMAQELLRLKAAASRPAAAAPPAAPDAALRRELKHQLERTGELEAENERLRDKVARLEEKPPDHCWYCLRVRAEVTFLLEGKQIMICDRCVARCAGIIATWKAELEARKGSRE